MLWQGKIEMILVGCNHAIASFFERTAQIVERRPCEVFWEERMKSSPRVQKIWFLDAGHAGTTDATEGRTNGILINFGDFSERSHAKEMEVEEVGSENSGFGDIVDSMSHASFEAREVFEDVFGTGGKSVRLLCLAACLSFGGGRVGARTLWG